MTIADYVEQNKIIEAPVTKDEPGLRRSTSRCRRTGWPPAPQARVGLRCDRLRQGQESADPPFMTAIYSKLTGNVDAAKVLEYAPGMLENLPGYEQDGDFKKETLSSSESIAFQVLTSRTMCGALHRAEDRRHPKGDALFVLQLNADAPLGQDDVIKGPLASSTGKRRSPSEQPQTEITV